MKKFIAIATLVSATFMFTKSQAQIKLSVNISSQPVWGPVGYDHAEYYYLPDIDVFYNVPKHQYIYMDGRQWKFSTSLPGKFGNYDLYNGYKIVVNEQKPYQRAAFYRTKYQGYKGRHDQQIIRNSHDQKYFEIKDHPEHNKWKNNQHRDDKGNNHRHS